MAFPIAMCDEYDEEAMRAFWSAIAVRKDERRSPVVDEADLEDKTIRPVGPETAALGPVRARSRALVR